MSLVKRILTADNPCLGCEEYGQTLGEAHSVSACFQDKLCLQLPDPASMICGQGDKLDDVGWGKP